MRRLLILLGFATLCQSFPALADEKPPLVLHAPAALTETGVLRHLVPRFALKTGIRIDMTPEAGTPGMVLARSAPGTPVLARGDVTYYLRGVDGPRATRFLNWLASDIGRRTIAGFTPADGTAFFAPDTQSAETDDLALDGDAARGADLSLTLCGRCHVVGEVNRLGGHPSTPSFAVLRTLPDWQARFVQFYVLRPHGPFTQVAGVTAPFDPDRPPALAPIHMTLEDLDAILAFVAATEAADLGQPLHLQ